MSGPKHNIQAGWANIRNTEVTIEPPTLLGTYVGCGHVKSHVDMRSPNGGGWERAHMVTFDMSQHVNTIADDYLKLAHDHTGASL